MGSNESSKHKMSDNDKSNEKRSKMDRRIKTLKKKQKKKNPGNLHTDLGAYY